jgi:hypothetical protein
LETLLITGMPAHIPTGRHLSTTGASFVKPFFKKRIKEEKRVKKGLTTASNIEGK